MTKIKLKPAAGLLVRHPETLQPLPKEGAEVVHSSYWLRRLAAGDVVLVQDQPPAKAGK